MSMWPDPYNPPYLVFDPQDFDEYWESFQSKDGQLICKPKTNMKQQIALSIEQMQELHSLGMDCSDASMCWITNRCNDTRLVLRPEASRLLDDHLLLSLNYAYTLEDVLINLPPSLAVDNIQYDLIVHPHWLHELWTVKYFNVSGDLKSMSAGHLMKVAFEMLKWVLKNTSRQNQKVITMDKPTLDLKGKTCLVTAKWSIFYGKEVEVISSAHLIIDGQPQWNCICKDGSSGGILPQNILKPV